MEKRRKLKNFFDKKQKIWVLGNVNMKVHAKFQGASSIGNTLKSRGAVQ